MQLVHQRDELRNAKWLLKTIKGIGETHSGLYYVTHVTHIFTADGYLQRFRVKRNGLLPTGAEDFSFVLEQVPGAYLMLGACPPGADPASAPNNHAGDAVFDDSVLGIGAALYAELALRRLAAH